MQKADLDSGEDSHYVYLYRNAEGKVLYVGYGANHSRATIHPSRSHSKTLASFLKKHKYSLDIAGPFRSKIVGCAVETALISVLEPEFNKHSGLTECRFRPFGLPYHFADRLVLPALNRGGFFREIGRAATAVLFVYIGDEDFDDGRPGYDPTKPPEDHQILKRMDRYWQIGRHLDGWRKTPSQSPAVLIGLTGARSRCNWGQVLQCNIPFATAKISVSTCDSCVLKIDLFKTVLIPANTNPLSCKSLDNPWRRVSYP